MQTELTKHQQEQIQTMARIREIDRTAAQLQAERDKLVAREQELGGIVATLRHMQQEQEGE